MKPNSNLARIHGNTYPVRADLKALGAKWNPSERAWYVAGEAARRKAQAIVDAVPAQAPRQSFTPHSSGLCKKCGSYCYGDCEAN